MWIVCQIGGREHYSIPRGLAAEGQLSALITDFWFPPGSPAARLAGTRRLSDRFHEDLGQATVHAPNFRMLSYEMLVRLRKAEVWERIMARNTLFQREALKILSRYQPPRGTMDEPISLFSYSYAALELFREAKKRGWTTVLGQIDPGPGEDALVRRLRAEHPQWGGASEVSPPESYWQSWREECALADRIVVNSPWSGSLLKNVGIEAAKIEVVPLAFEARAAGSDHRDVMRGTDGGRLGTHGIRFSSQRPLKVLWLGQAIVRKGIQDLAATARKLADLPVIIDVVGPHPELPSGLPANLKFHGAVPRSQARDWYSKANVFVLPTHSDGFAITQIEAMAHGVPVIATPCCGEVVADGANGWIIPAGDPEALARAIRSITRNPAMLEPMRAAAKATAAKFSLAAMTKALLRG